MTTRALPALGGIVLWAIALEGATQRTDTVKVISFGGLASIPMIAAEAHGILAADRLTVVTEITPDSKILRDGLAVGTFDVAHAAADNAVAMVEVAGHDVVLVLGGDDSMNELYVQPDVESVPALRGRTVLVDAPTTAYALQLKKILRAHGLEAGVDYTVVPLGGTPRRRLAMEEDRRYAATLLSPPSSILAGRAGLRSLGRAATLLGPYQGISAFVRRAWGREHREVLVRYLAAYVEGLRWFLAPANRREAEALLATSLNLTPDVANETYRAATASSGGLAPDAAMSVEGLRTVLRLRAEIEGQWNGTPPAAEKYYDPSYYTEALARIGQ